MSEAISKFPGPAEQPAKCSNMSVPNLFHMEEKDHKIRKNNKSLLFEGTKFWR